MTLVEIMAALTILAIVLLGIQLMLASASEVDRLNRIQNMITFDLHTVVNHVKSVPLHELLDPKFIEVDEDTGMIRLAAVPHGGVVDPRLYSSVIDEVLLSSPDGPDGKEVLGSGQIIIRYTEAGGQRKFTLEPHLRDEQIIVFYFDRGGIRLPLPNDPEDAIGTSNIITPFDTPDPLRFTARLTYRNTKNETVTESLTAVRTR